MTMYKVRLVCPVELTASLEFEMEAESEDEVYEKAYDEYQRRDKEYQLKLNEYHRAHEGRYPEAPFYWQVDSDDIEANMNERDIEVSDVEEAE